MILASNTITLVRVNDGAKGATGEKGAPGVDFSQGKMLNTDPMFATGSNGCSKYNNKSNDTVTVTRASKSPDNPMTGTNYELVVTTTGEASPGLGGFYQSITSRANAVFIRRIIAKIPSGYTLVNAQNNMGDGYTVEWLTPQNGTGKFTEYIYKYTCGTSGTFSSGGHVYINGTAATSTAPVTWYVAYSTTFDMTDVSDVSTARKEASEAAKTATNYISFDGSGLVVGDMTASSLGKNVMIDSDSVDIRNGSTTLASFGAKTITLGQNANDSVINLCDGAGRISANTSSASTSYPHRNAILIDSQEIETEGVRFVANVSNAYGASSTPATTREAELYMLRSSGSSESCARLQAEHKITSSGAYTKSGISAMTYDAASSTRAMVFASDSANSKHNQVNVYPTKTTLNKPLFINGTEFTGSNKVLWSGGYYMSSGQTATLSSAISSQANGVVLLWSYYVDGANDNSNFQSYFIPKHFVSLFNGKGLSMFMTNGSMGIAASKYVYISDTSLSGYSGNNANAADKTCGITSTPKNFVLRYVIGV